MAKEKLSTEAAPAAIGPYSQGTLANGFVFVSGQLPIDPSTGSFAGETIAEQTAQSIKNVESILKTKGLSLEDVVKTTVFLKDIHDFVAMNEVYATYFTGDCPARSAFQVVALPKGALLEIEAIAAK